MSTICVSRRGFLGTSLGLSLAGTSGVLAGETTKSAGRNGLSWKDNQAIQNARQAALRVLKPSRKELEHGLELHANSLVFDGYGFSPRLAVDGKAIAAAIEAGASKIELEDMREDMYMTRCVTNPAEEAEFKEAWKAAGVTCIFQNAGQEGQDPMCLLKRLARYIYVTDMMRDFVSKAATPDDILAAKKANRHCLYFTGNGVPLRQHWVSVEDELRYVRIFFQLGIRMMHLTYQRRNMIGDGCGEKSDAGLSDFGRAAIAEMNRVGVIVDVAHCGWKTSLEAAKTSRRPMVASHTACVALHNHYRNKPDEVIHAIADTGGAVGIVAQGGYLGGRCNIITFLDHIDYVAKKYGVNHVSIGTDVAHYSRNTQAENKKIPERPKYREDFRSLWPPNTSVTKPPRPKSPKKPKRTGPSTGTLAWTNWPMFTVGLVQRGISDDDIQKIIGGNMLRVARDVLTK